MVSRVVATKQANGAPPNASNAPSASNETFTGLCEALNSHQQDLVKQEKQAVADIYSIEFTPDTLGAYQVADPGSSTVLSKTAMQNPNTAKNKLDPATNKVANNTKAWQVTAGTQIIQLIDQVMRGSRYITDQQNTKIEPVPDPKTGLQKQTSNPRPSNGITAWYKITMQSTQLKYDWIRKDHAYAIKYIVSPYALNQMASQYFPDSRYRGSHKSYYYWFTGENTQVLQFEQEYNNLYRLTVSGIGKDIQSKTTVDFREQYRKTYMPTSENRGQGLAGYTNEPADNAASFFYSPTDQARANLRIIGDPAWMQQGEVGLGVTAKNFNFNPFNPDGGINYESQEILFDLSFNPPTDYNLNTGITEVNNIRNQAHENRTYTAIRCKSIFRQGRFEQQLEGRMLIEYTDLAKQKAAVARPVATTAKPTIRKSNTNRINSVEEINYDNQGNPINSNAEPLKTPTPTTPTPAAPPRPPTSGAENLNGEQPPVTTANQSDPGQPPGAPNPQIIAREA